MMATENRVATAVLHGRQYAAAAQDLAATKRNITTKTHEMLRSTAVYTFISLTKYPGIS